MSAVLGLTRDEKHRYQWNGGPLVPGVTSIIRALDKSGPLVGWAKREAAATAVRNHDLITTMLIQGGPDAAIKWIASTPDYQRDTSADLGTRVHDLAEAIVRKQDVTIDEEAAPFVSAYLRWLDENRPKVLNAEFMVYSERHGYGGTADAALLLGSDVWLVDYKTGKAAYAETALQLAGLHNADWAGRPGDPKKYAIPKATRFGVLHIRPEGAQLIPYQVGPAEFAAFLACRQLTTWLAERAPFVKSEREKGVIAA
jgi:hypothetical protein